MLAVLKYREFRYLWMGQVVSRIGDSIFGIGLAWLAFRLTGSALSLSIALIMQVVPALCFGMFAGVFADRYRRVTVMIIADLLRGVLLLYTGCAIFFDFIDIFQIYAVTFLVFSISIFFDSAYQSLIPQVVPKEALAESNAIISMVRNFTDIFSRLLGGALVAWMGEWFVCLMNSASFFISLLFIVLSGASHVQIGGEAKGKSKTLLMESFRYLRSNQGVMLLILLMVLINIGIGPLTVALPLLAAALTQDGAFHFGVMSAAIAVGGVLGASISIKIKRHMASAVLNHLVVFVFTGLLVLLAFADWYPLALFLLFLIGIFITVTSVFVNTNLQLTVPNQLLGRVSAVKSMALRIAPIVSLLVAGLLASVFGTSVMLIMFGVILSLLTLLALAVFSFSPFLRKN